MPPRTKRIFHDENTRNKIKTTQIINRLTAHINGEISLSATQVQSAKILLDRTLPALASVEHTGEVEYTYVIRAPQPIESHEEWSQKHSLQ